MRAKKFNRGFRKLMRRGFSKRGAIRSMKALAGYQRKMALRRKRKK